MIELQHGYIPHGMIESEGKVRDRYYLNPANVIAYTIQNNSLIAECIGRTIKIYTIPTPKEVEDGAEKESIYEVRDNLLEQLSELSNAAVNVEFTLPEDDCDIDPVAEPTAEPPPAPPVPPKPRRTATRRKKPRKKR